MKTGKLTLLKKGAAALLALSMTVTAFAGCSSTEGSSAAGSAGSSASSGTTESSGAESSAESSAVKADYSAGLTEDGFWDGVKALDYVTLPDYKGVSIPADISAVSEESVQEQVDTIMANYATAEQVKDREVKDGDTVNIDYVGSVDGVEFEGGNTGGQGTSVTIGVTQYIDDFLEQLIGHKPGETFDVNVTFPDPYSSNTELSGKDAVFKTTVNYIEETPEATDEFVAETLAADYGWTTVAQMKEEIETNLRETAESEYAWDYISQNAKVSEVPESMIEFQKNNLKYSYEARAQQYGVDLDTFLSSYTNYKSLDEAYETNADQLKENAQGSLIKQAISEDAGLKPTEENLTAYFKENMGSEDYSSYTEQYGLPYIKMIIREDMVNDLILENAKRA